MKHMQVVMTRLSQTEREQLRILAESPGYVVLKRLMEMVCTLQDAELSKTDPSDERKVLAEHRIDIAMWAFFESVTKQVEHELRELRGENEVPSDGSDPEIENLLNPLRGIV